MDDVFTIEVSRRLIQWSHGGKHYGSWVFGSVESRVRIEFWGSYFPVTFDDIVSVQHYWFCSRVGARLRSLTFFSESDSIWNLWICSYWKYFLIYLLSHSTNLIICLLAVSQRTLRGWIIHEPLQKPSDVKKHWKRVASSLTCNGMHNLLQCDYSPQNKKKLNY